MNNIKCLFGYHEFVIPNKDDKYILMCKHCMRVGYYKFFDGYERWYDFDEKGNKIHWKDSYGYEEWLYDGVWITRKPENWEDEKEIK